jgi:NifB/MoaA-like Fe-S oxidoreductase
MADEYYLRAGKPIPPRARYDGFPQYQNGIGMVRDLMDQWKALQKRSPVLDHPTHITAICGELIAPVLEPITAQIGNVVPLRRARALSSARGMARPGCALAE